MALIFLRGSRLTRLALGSVRKSMRSPTVSKTFNPVDVLQEPSTLRSRQIGFRMERFNLGIYNVVVTLRLRKGLEDGCP
jgi:hypothetical protein